MEREIIECSPTGSSCSTSKAPSSRSIRPCSACSTAAERRSSATRARRSRIPTTTRRNCRSSRRCSKARSDGYTIDKRYLRRNGEPVWARLDLRVIRDEQGQPLRLLALIEDISERRRHDDEQKRLTERLIEHSASLQRALTAAEHADEQVRTILECITDGFVALDRRLALLLRQQARGRDVRSHARAAARQAHLGRVPRRRRPAVREGIPRGDGGADDHLPRGVLRAVGPVVRKPHLRLAHRHRHLLHGHHRAEARRGGRAAATQTGRGAADGERRSSRAPSISRRCSACCSTR